MNKWQRYEQEKRALRALRLPPVEYERRLRQLAGKLGL